tara:strand:- start:3690 stop:4811 length:1122 start_codon:yes stop_codon:yes gene_type:complete
MFSNHNIIPKDNNYVLIKNNISISSLDRDISKWKNNNHFEINLPQSFNNIHYINITNITLPFNQFNISNQFQNNKIRIHYGNPNIHAATVDVSGAGNVEFNVTIDDGFYSPFNLAIILQNSINTQLKSLLNIQPFIVKYNKITNKFFIGVTEGQFKLLFNFQHPYTNCSKIKFNNNAKWGLGWLLGFDKKVYSSIRHTDSNGLKFSHENTAWITPTTKENDSNTSINYIEANNQFKFLQHQDIFLEVTNHNNTSEIEPYSQNTNNSNNNDLGFKQNSAFAKIPIPYESFAYYIGEESQTTAYHNVINLSNGHFITNPKFHLPPIKSINKLKFKFRYHDGDLVDFNNVPISMMIEIGTLEEEQRRIANIRHNKF